MRVLSTVVGGVLLAYRGPIEVCEEEFQPTRYGVYMSRLGQERQLGVEPRNQWEEWWWKRGCLGDYLLEDHERI